MHVCMYVCMYVCNYMYVIICMYVCNYMYVVCLPGCSQNRIQVPNAIQLTCITQAQCDMNEYDWSVPLTRPECELNYIMLTCSGMLGRLIIQVNDQDTRSCEGSSTVGRRRRGSSCEPNARGSVVHELLEDAQELIGTVDGAGRRIEQFVQVPARHHKDSVGKPIPAPIVPLHWVTHSFVFDGALLLSYNASLEVNEEDANQHVQQHTSSYAERLT
jgi:hypothetical protein